MGVTYLLMKSLVNWKREKKNNSKVKNWETPDNKTAWGTSVDCKPTLPSTVSVYINCCTSEYTLECMLSWCVLSVSFIGYNLCNSRYIIEVTHYWDRNLSAWYIKCIPITYLLNILWSSNPRPPPPVGHILWINQSINICNK